MIEEIGFEDVFIDDSNSLMAFNDEENEEIKKVSTESDKNSSEDKKRSVELRKKTAVHVGSAEFEHLSAIDMNDICARVVVYGRKPQWSFIGWKMLVLF